MEQMPASHRAWAEAFPDCDSGPIAKTGVAYTPISQQRALELMFLHLSSRPVPLRQDDFVEGYMSEPRPGAIDSLNIDNQYREVGGELKAALQTFIAEQADWITSQLGHAWRVCSVRPFELRAREQPGGKHVDGWPLSIRKAFILPAGASRQGGTTWFKLRDGREVIFEHPDPCLLIFENSAVEHCSVPGRVYRPTIEFDIVPARHVDPEPVYAGLNGWFPWMPEVWH